MNARPSRPHRGLLFLATVVSLLATACAGSGGSRFIVTDSGAPFVPVIESTDVSVGAPRLVLSLLDRAVQPQFSPKTTFSLRYFEPVEGGVRFRVDESLHVIRVSGETFYVGRAPLDRAGEWQLEVTATSPGEEPQTSARLPFIVEPTSTTPAIGQAAVASQTLTTKDLPLAQLSSDPAPAAALYDTSIAEALERPQPFVIVFASVGSCFGSGACQRALDQVKRLAPAAGVLAIHVEPFGAHSDSGILDDWCLENDPWIFVVSGDGTVLAKFEVVVSDADLAAALQAAADTAAPVTASPPEPAQGESPPAEAEQVAPPTDVAPSDAGEGENASSPAADSNGAAPIDEPAGDEALAPVVGSLEGILARLIEHQAPVGELSDGQFIFARVEYAIPGWVDDARVVLLIRHEESRVVTIEEVLERFPDVQVNDPGLAFENNAFATFLPAEELSLDGQSHVAVLQGFTRTQDEIAETFSSFGWQWSDFVPGPYVLAEPQVLVVIWIDGERIVIGEDGDALQN